MGLDISMTATRADPRHAAYRSGLAYQENQDVWGARFKKRVGDGWTICIEIAWPIYEFVSDPLEQPVRHNRL